MTSKTRIRSQEGFTLVEAMISLVIVGVLLAGLIHGMTLAALQRNLHDQREQVLGVVRFHMETAALSDYGSMVQGTTQFNYPDEIPNSNLVVKVRVQDIDDADFDGLYPDPNDDPGTDYRYVTVTGIWTPPASGVEETIVIGNYITPNSNSIWNE